MRIMHILDSLNRGGAEMLALDVCRNARESGLDLTFVATGGGELETDFQSSGASFIRLHRRLPVDTRVVAGLRRIIREREIQVVHCHQAVEMLHAYLATRGGGRTRRVLSFHLCAADAKNRLALKFLAPRMDANVAVSRELLSCLEQESGFETNKNFRVVYNGVDAARLRATTNSLRAELCVGEGDLLLGMVGNFYAGARKDQLTVCRALPAVFRRAPHARFVFVGGHQEGTGAQLYRNCVSYCRAEGIADRVHFLGKRPDIADVLGALDVFVFSSFYEGMPIAVIEAMTMGVPCVVSDIGALLEVSRQGEHAAVFRTGDADDLSQCLLALINDAPRRARLGAEARGWATKQFSIEAHLAHLQQLYDELAARS